jgi:hypothetical protein
MHEILTLALSLLLLIPRPSASAEPAGAVVSRSGDWTVTGVETVRDQHIRLDGNLILERDAVLTLENCTLEIIGPGSRDHLVDWRGGKLVTRNTTIGGAIRDGVAIHTVFHIYDGEWDAVDTIVQYAYGFSFHAETRGVLRGERLHAGPRPDAVIASGKADITLIDSTFPIAIGVYTNAGGSATFDLPVGEPVTRVFDGSNVPGAEYRMELTRHVVPYQWFLFLRRVSMDAPPCEVVLRDCPRVLVSLLSWNVEGELTLTGTLDEPLRMGSVTLRRADRPVNVSMWSLYGGGPKYDLTVHGRDTRIAEFMHRGGTVRLRGRPGTRDFNLGCTTLEMSGDAQLDLQDLHLGRPTHWSPSRAMGEANVAGNARLTGRNVGVHRVVFRTRENGQVEITDVDQGSTFEAREEGGPVKLATGSPPDNE